MNFARYGAAGEEKKIVIVHEMLHHHLYFGARWGAAFLTIIAISRRRIIRAFTFLSLLLSFLILLFNHWDLQELLELVKDISPTYLFVIVAYYTMEKARDIYQERIVKFLEQE